MILNETDYLRQAIEKILFVLMVLVIILLVIFFSVVIIYFFKEEFQTQINIAQIQETSVFSKTNFINSVLENELSMFLNSKIEFQNEIIEKNNDASVQFEIHELPKIKYEIPKEYEVKNLGNEKIEVGNTKISNYSNLELNFEELSKPLSMKMDSNTNFLVFHTHATESYTIESEYVENYRSTHPECNMISIGKVLAQQLEARGFHCMQDTILHDYPNYNGSYKHSLDTITKYLKTKEFDFIFDIHRDAISRDLTYGPTCEISGESVAQLMFVIGTNASGLKHDNWMENLKFAIMIQNRANEMYPGLFRDINLSSSRYNQHVSIGACIIEVGTTGNTLEEAKNSMKYLSNVIESFK